MCFQGIMLAKQGIAPWKGVERELLRRLLYSAGMRGQLGQDDRGGQIILASLVIALLGKGRVEVSGWRPGDGLLGCWAVWGLLAHQVHLRHGIEEEISR